jgi:hypothetical protein
MVLDSIADGASRLLQAYDEDTRRLTAILCLPLVDGVFATLLVSGTLETFSSMIAVSLTIFTGAGALAVLYSSTETISEARSMVLKAAPVLLIGALAVSLVAPVFEQIFHVERMRTVAGLVLLSIGLRFLDIEKAEVLSVPAILITGAALSLKNPAALSFSLTYVAPALVTALSSSAALYVAASIDHSALDLSVVRRGAGVVLLMLAVSQLGVQVPSNLGIAVFGLSVLASHEKTGLEVESFRRELSRTLL